MPKPIYKITTFNPTTRLLLEFYHILDQSTLPVLEVSVDEWLQGMYSTLGTVKVTKAEVTGKVCFETNGNHCVELKIGGEEVE